jgi:hypothetical protein
MARHTAQADPQTDAPQTDAPQTDAPQTDAPQTDAPQTDTPKALTANFIASGAFDLSAAADMSETIATAGAPQRARNERQQAMDAEVSKLHAHWIEAGRPSTWGTLVSSKSTLTYFVEPELAADFKKTVTKAVNYLGIRVRWGSSFVATEAMQQKFGLPAEYVGREVISFAALDRRPRNTTDVPDASGEVSDNNE